MSDPAPWALTIPVVPWVPPGGLPVINTARPPETVMAQDERPPFVPGKRFDPPDLKSPAIDLPAVELPDLSLKVPRLRVEKPPPPPTEQAWLPRAGRSKAKSPD
jgi:hypothetical protein